MCKSRARHKNEQVGHKLKKKVAKSLKRTRQRTHCIRRKQQKNKHNSIVSCCPLRNNTCFYILFLLGVEDHKVYYPGPWLNYGLLLLLFFVVVIVHPANTIRIRVKVRRVDNFNNTIKTSQLVLYLVYICCCRLTSISLPKSYYVYFRHIRISLMVRTHCTLCVRIAHNTVAIYSFMIEAEMTGKNKQ